MLKRGALFFVLLLAISTTTKCQEEEEEDLEEVEKDACSGNPCGNGICHLDEDNEEGR